MVANLSKRRDAYEGIHSTPWKGAASLITIDTLLQFGIFLIACIVLVIKLINLSNKNNHPNFSVRIVTKNYLTLPSFERAYLAQV